MKNKSDGRIVIDIFSPNHSLGLRHDISVLGMGCRKILGDSVVIRTFFLPLQAYRTIAPSIRLPSDFERPGHIAIFIERVFNADFLKQYQERAVLINPEWFSKDDLERSEIIVESVLHKTEHYYKKISRLLPRHKHYFIGFTSNDPGKRVVSYDSFSHFRGKSKHRHSQLLIDIWRAKNPCFPLFIQAYGSDISLNTNQWVSNGPMHFYFGHLNRNQYLKEFSNHGLSLCTSSVEGFGHYINEACAMAAIPIVLDAPPMNELVSSNYGIMVPCKQVSVHFLGEVYQAIHDDLNQAIDTACKLSMQEKQRMGERARRAFIERTAGFIAQFEKYILPTYQRINQNIKNKATSRLQKDNANSAENKVNTSVFDDIYERGGWGRSLGTVYSGPGSHDKNIVQDYVSAITDFIEQLGQTVSAVDLGCGDFNIGSRICAGFSRYIACDISRKVIEHNKEKYNFTNVEFILLNAVTDDLPSGDVVIIRQVLQHLDNKSVFRIVRKIEKTFKYAIITEHLPIGNFKPNLDKRVDKHTRLLINSGLVLTLPPFSLQHQQQTVLTTNMQLGGRIVTWLFRLNRNT